MLALRLFLLQVLKLFFLFRFENLFFLNDYRTYHHNDTTCAKLFGDADNRRSDQGLEIPFGYSKQYRQDLKQLVWSLSVSADSALPLFQEAYSGNTADVETYVAQWHHLIDLLGKRDFLFVGDSKVASRKNLAHIHDKEGFFICPLPMYATYEHAFAQALETHDLEVLLPYKGHLNRGVEVPLGIEYEDRAYPFRMIVLFDHGVFHRKKKSLEQRVSKTKEDGLVKKGSLLNRLI